MQKGYALNLEKLLLKSKKYFNYRLATRNDRFIAFLIDWLFVGASYYVLEWLIPNYQTDYLVFILTTSLFDAVLGAITYPLWGGNIGHKIMKIKVISITTGKTINNPLIGALREGIKTLIFPLYVLSFLKLLNDKNQNLLDKTMGIIVVKTGEIPNFSSKINNS